jgi:hypothetical protein
MAVSILDDFQTMDPFLRIIDRCGAHSYETFDVSRPRREQL